MKYDRLVCRRKYRVPLHFSKISEAIEKLLCPPETEILPGCSKWKRSFVLGHSERFMNYYLNPAYNFITSKMRVSDTSEELEKLRKEYKQDIRKQTPVVIASLQHGIPFDLRILIIDTDESSSVCQAECRSALYMKLRQEMVKEGALSEFQIEESHSESLSFLDYVFIGGLEGKPIPEMPVITSKFELVVNSTKEREITELVDSLLDNATGEVLICGWIGTRSVPKLIELAGEGVNVRLITHRPSEAKNRPWKNEVIQAFEKLCSGIGKKNICFAPNMHGRIVVVDDKALIGSMDLNAYSLTGAHIEFAIYTDEPKIVRRLRKVFNSKFKPLETS